MRLPIHLFAVWMSLAGMMGMEPASGSAADRSLQDPLAGAERPIVALWRQHGGGEPDEAPYLRFAIWADGRVLYANDPTRWNHELRRGRISAARMSRLKAALADSGVFDLQGNCYLVPSAPQDCLIVELAGKQQMLFWDERESPNYGINIDPRPHHLQFNRCWKHVNHLALLALPDEGEAVDARIEIPESWHLKEPIQSE
jgi:hypothetical protein